MLKRSVLCVVLGMLVVPSLVMADAPAGKVRSKLGDVDRQKLNQESWKPLSVGASVFQSDRVRTGTESEVIFGLPDGSVISIAENAEIVLSELLEKNGAFKTKFEIKKGHMNFDVKKLSKNSSFEFKTGTATAAIRGTKGFIGGAKGFVGSLKEGKLEIQASNGKTVSIGAGETALGRDSLVVVKLPSSGNPDLAKQLEKVVEDTTLTLDQMVEAAKVADSSVAKEPAAAEMSEDLVISSATANVCEGGLKIEGSYRAVNVTSTLVVKVGTYESENFATSTDGQVHNFSAVIPVTDANGLWTANTAEVVLKSGDKVTSKKVNFSVDKSCAEVNTKAGTVKFANYDSLRCVANVSIAGIENESAIFAVMKDGAPAKQEALTRNALKRVKLYEGVHDYSFELTDMAKNKVSVKRTLGCYPPKKFNVNFIGKNREVVNYPMPAPNMPDNIVKTVQFTIKVPGGEPDVLYKVVVKQNGRIILQETMSQIQALDYQVPIELKRSSKNKVEVEVTHKSGYVVKVQKLYEVN